MVIVGAGHAGGTVAALLRQYGHQGEIVLIGEEPVPPYQRPPLSKAWLKGEADAESLLLKPAEFYPSAGIDFRPGARVVRIARGESSVILSDGRAIGYQHLVIATGARATVLPVDGAELQGVRFLRNTADAEALKAEVAPGKRLAIVGGGYIGLEVAASARLLGAEVIVLEREERLAARVASVPVSRFLHSHHERNGVIIRLGCKVVGFEGESGRIVGVRLAEGSIVHCDTVLVGVGAQPNDEMAAEAGLSANQGVIVDLDARSVTDPRVFAIGDVARRPMPIYGRMARLESVPNALEQAKQAASAITARPRPADECPWQWSDQYDVKLQIAGYPIEAEDLLIRGEPSSGSFAVFHLKGDLVQAVEAINAPPEFMMGKSLILNRRPVNRTRLSDLNFTMKEIAA